MLYFGHVTKDKVKTNPGKNKISKNKEDMKYFLGLTWYLTLR